MAGALMTAKVASADERLPVADLLGARPDQEDPQVLEHRSECYGVLSRRRGSNVPVLVVLTGGRSRSRADLVRLAEQAVTVGQQSPTDPPRLPRPAQQQRRLLPEEQAELVRAYVAGALVQELAARYGVHRTTVTANLQQSGVELRRRGMSPKQLQEAVRLYAEGWSCQRLGDRYRCDDETVRQRLKRAGVKLREPWERR